MLRRSGHGEGSILRRVDGRWVGVLDPQLSSRVRKNKGVE
jgi:hypothetical protein